MVVEGIRTLAAGRFYASIDDPSIQPASDSGPARSTWPRASNVISIDGSGQGAGLERSASSSLLATNTQTTTTTLKIGDACGVAEQRANGRTDAASQVPNGRTRGTAQSSQTAVPMLLRSEGWNRSIDRSSGCPPRMPDAPTTIALASRRGYYRERASSASKHKCSTISHPTQPDNHNHNHKHIHTQGARRAPQKQCRRVTATTARATPTWGCRRPTQQPQRPQPHRPHPHRRRADHHRGRRRRAQGAASGNPSSGSPSGGLWTSCSGCRWTRCSRWRCSSPCPRCSVRTRVTAVLVSIHVHIYTPRGVGIAVRCNPSPPFPHKPLNPYDTHNIHHLPSALGDQPRVAAAPRGGGAVAPALRRALVPLLRGPGPPDRVALHPGGAKRELPVVLGHD